MSILENLDKNNLHHAYLIEGVRDDVVEEVLGFIKGLGIDTLQNPDFCQITIDSFKMDEALSLREMGAQKSFSEGKKFFLVSANSFTLDAQQALLKMFEEPIENTHFFIVVPETDALLKTLISRFYLIKHQSKEVDLSEATSFLKMPLAKRIDYLKGMLVEEDEEDMSADGVRSKAIKFLNAIEMVLHKQFVENGSLDAKTDYFNQIFKAREFLRQPGSATKTLMESVALSIPLF